MQVRHSRIDFQSGTAVCNAMEKWQEKIKHYEDQIHRHQSVLTQRYGEEASRQLYDEFQKWFERKSAAWTRCYELVQQHNVFNNSIRNLEQQSKRRVLLEYEMHKLREMRVKAEETMHVAERIRLELIPLNRAVVQSCMSGMPPPPTPAAASSAILSFVLHLQKVTDVFVSVAQLVPCVRPAFVFCSPDITSYNLP
jgi:hypothetical protein